MNAKKNTTTEYTPTTPSTTSTPSTTTTPSTTVSQTSIIDQLLTKAKKISDITEAWDGLSPSQTNLEPEHFDLDMILDQPIIVLGFSVRSGEKSPFYIVFGVFEDSKRPFTVACGGSVVIKKLNIVKEKRAFPVKGIISMPEGKNYYDFFSLK